MPRVAGKRSYKGRRYAPYKNRRVVRIPRVSNFNPMLSARSALSGFPTTLRTKLKYHEAIALSSVAGTVSGNVFRAEALFDPNETGTGHQPMFFDSFAAVYNRYVVRGARIKVTFNPTTETAATSMWVVGIVGQSTNTIQSDPNVLCEQGHSVWADVNGRNGGPNQKTLYLNYTPEKHLNLSYLDNDVGALVTSNPAVSYKFIIYGADRQSSGTTNMVAEVEIVYDCEFSDVITNAGS